MAGTGQYRAGHDDWAALIVGESESFRRLVRYFT